MQPLCPQIANALMSSGSKTNNGLRIAGLLTAITILWSVVDGLPNAWAPLRLLPFISVAVTLLSARNIHIAGASALNAIVSLNALVILDFVLKRRMKFIAQLAKSSNIEINNETLHWSAAWNLITKTGNLVDGCV